MIGRGAGDLHQLTRQERFARHLAREVVLARVRAGRAPRALEAVVRQAPLGVPELLRHLAVHRRRRVRVHGYGVCRRRVRRLRGVTAARAELR